MPCLAVRLCTWHAAPHHIAHIQIRTHTRIHQPGSIAWEGVLRMCSGCASLPVALPAVACGWGRGQGAEATLRLVDCIVTGLHQHEPAVCMIETACESTAVNTLVCAYWHVRFNCRHNPHRSGAALICLPPQEAPVMPMQLYTVQYWSLYSSGMTQVSCLTSCL